MQTKVVEAHYGSWSLNELLALEMIPLTLRKLLDEKIRLEESLKGFINDTNNPDNLTAKVFRFAHEALIKCKGDTPETKKHRPRDRFELFVERQKLSINMLESFVLIENALNVPRLPKKKD